MIFVCVGSRSYPFDRLFKKLDELVEKGLINDEIFAQTGASKYKPRHYAFISYMDRDTFDKKMDEADIIISHAATGSIIQALKNDKKVIGVARLAKYGEHVDDHQIQTNQVFAENKYILAVNDMAALYDAVKSCQESAVDLVKWENAKPRAIIDLIDKFIQDNF